MSQVSEGLLDEIVQSVHACGKEIEIYKSSSRSCQDVFQRTGLAWPLLLWTSSTRDFGILGTCREQQILIFMSSVFPDYSMAVRQTVNCDVEKRINGFVTVYLHRTKEHYRND